MKDNFQWDDKLVQQFAEEYRFSSSRTSIEQFKSSKAPKKEWEVVDLKNEYGHTENYHHFNEGVVEDKITKGKLTIHSVRRLSDNEIFSVGDKINSGIITRIHAADWPPETLVLMTESANTPIGSAEKLPAPLFVTTDGVDIYPGDKCSFVFDDDWTRYLDADYSFWKPRFDNAWRDFKAFSTREAAEDYIFNNRPLLSLNDVKEILKNDFQVHSVWLLNELTTLVKQKLNP